MKKLLTAGVLFLLASAGVTVILTRQAGANQVDGTPRSTFSTAAALSFGDFALYDVGDSLQGLPVTAVLRHVKSDGSANYVSFIHGDCQPTSDHGCAPPLEVQVWPACIRNPSLYANAGNRGIPFENAIVRGVPSAFFEDGARLELQTGTSTVVVFGTSKAQVTRAAESLQGVNVPVQAWQALPAPAPGALTGGLKCTA